MSGGPMECLTSSEITALFNKKATDFLKHIDQDLAHLYGCDRCAKAFLTQIRRRIKKEKVRRGKFLAWTKTQTKQ